jgi:hypothetical protein
VLPLLLLAASAWAAPAPVELVLDWTYEGLPAGMRVLEASDKTPELWTTETTDKRESIPAGAELAGGRVSLRAGEQRTLVLAYRNPGTAPLRFFAAPHSAKPAAASLGLDFECLCLNHVYAVGPGRWWWRVVRLSLSEDATAPRLAVSHALVRVTDAKKKGRPLGRR